MEALLRFAPVTDPDQLVTIARMAHEIWYEYYVSLIGRAQVDYMVERFQSVRALQEQIDEGYEYFVIERRTERAEPASIGYVAVRPEPSQEALFLSKLYLLAGVRGTGMGRQALTFVEGLARSRGLQRIWLTVNKGNSSRFAYERLGYVTTGSIVIDIGGGFVMDDYRMEKFLG